MSSTKSVRGSLILDFDSTLVPCESLEELLDTGDDAIAARIAEITRAGMEGRLEFRQSLEQRLALVRPERERALLLGADLARRVGHDVRDALTSLTAARVQLWIVSGAFREVLLPTAELLCIAPDRVAGVRPIWNDDGTFAALDPADPFATSKVLGVRALSARPSGGFARPAIGVGDGATDRALFDAGLVDRFVAFSGHARRTGVAAPAASGAVAEARDFGEVRALVETWLP
jgi:phosphoserine phosphatase